MSMFVAGCSTDSKRSSEPKPITGPVMPTFGWLPNGMGITIEPLQSQRARVAPQTWWCVDESCDHPEGFTYAEALGAGEQRITASVQYLRLDDFQRQQSSALPTPKTKFRVGNIPAIIDSSRGNDSLGIEPSRTVTWDREGARLRVTSNAATFKELLSDRELLRIADALTLKPITSHRPRQIKSVWVRSGVTETQIQLLFLAKQHCLWVQPFDAATGGASGRCTIDPDVPTYSTAPVPLLGGGLGTAVYGASRARGDATLHVESTDGTRSERTVNTTVVDGLTLVFETLLADERVVGISIGETWLQREWNGPSLPDFPPAFRGVDAAIPLNTPYTFLETFDDLRIFAVVTESQWCALADQQDPTSPEIVRGVVSICTSPEGISGAVTPDGTRLVLIAGESVPEDRITTLRANPLVQAVQQIRFPKYAGTILVATVDPTECLSSLGLDVLVDPQASDRSCDPSSERE